jgi:hypothetical protein
MTDLKLTFTKEELAGIYFLSQLGIISLSMQSHIKDVELLDDSSSGRAEYEEKTIDYEKTLLQLSNLPEESEESAYEKLNEILDVLNNAYQNL